MKKAAKDVSSGRRDIWTLAGLIALFNGALTAWIVVRPGPYSVVQGVDDIAQTLGPLLMWPLGIVLVRKLWRRPAPAATVGAGASAAIWTAPRRAALFLSLAVVTDTIAQAVYTYYQLVLRQQAPLPSWADPAYLCTYPLLLLGILSLPTRPLPSAARVRVLMDGLLIMTALVTFSWYFVLGPTVLQGGETLLAKAVSTAYPLEDLVLMSSLLLLSSRASDPSLRTVVRILSVSLACTIIADSVYDYQSLGNAYATGELIDVGWPLGDMLIGLAVYALYRTNRIGLIGATDQERNNAEARQPHVWRVLLPYALLPAVGILVLYTGRTHGNENLKIGVWIGGATLIGLVVVRQVLAILETGQLYQRLNDAYLKTMTQAEETQALNEELCAIQDELQGNNGALVEANMRLQALATTDPLTGLPNHRALVAALDHEIERTRRYDRPCSVLFLDLDHFKALNDTCGHQVGDLALNKLAATVRSTLRGIDTLGRWGGEEFVAILPETTMNDGLTIAERIRGAVAAQAFTAGGSAHLTCSIGIATCPDTGLDRDGIVAAADRAMYAAKRLGRNQVRAANDVAVTALDGDANGTGSREEAALVGTVEALATLVEARDHYTGQHTQEVALLVVRLALTLGRDVAEARLIGLAGRLHDVGKVVVPDTVLQKPGRLDEEEWVLMRTHPLVGADVVGRVPALRALAPLIRAHHERWDGTGYPDGLAGAAIPLGARVVAVADTYGAMTTDRPYRRACPAAHALDELRRCAGTQFDPAIVAALERVLTDEAMAARGDVA